MRKYQQQYIKENGFDDYVMEQAMLNSGHTGTSKMIPGYLPPPPMPPLTENDLDADIGYKSLPPLPPFNGKGDYGGIAGRSVKILNFKFCSYLYVLFYPILIACFFYLQYLWIWRRFQNFWHLRASWQNRISARKHGMSRNISGFGWSTIHCGEHQARGRVLQGTRNKTYDN